MQLDSHALEVLLGEFYAGALAHEMILYVVHQARAPFVFVKVQKLLFVRCGVRQVQYVNAQVAEAAAVYRKKKGLNINNHQNTPNRSQSPMLTDANRC